MYVEEVRTGRKSHAFQTLYRRKKAIKLMASVVPCGGYHARTCPIRLDSASVFHSVSTPNDTVNILIILELATLTSFICLLFLSYTFLYIRLLQYPRCIFYNIKFANIFQGLERTDVVMDKQIFVFL